MANTSMNFDLSINDHDLKDSFKNAPKDLNWDGCELKGVTEDGEEIKLYVQGGIKGTPVIGSNTLNFNDKEITLEDNSITNYADRTVTVEKLAGIIKNIREIKISLFSLHDWKLPKNLEVSLRLGDRFIFDSDHCHINVEFDKFVG